MTRYAMAVEYDGGAFHGWQTQRDRTSVQQVLESALSKIADHPVAVVAAGRTDTGVHARFQVVHFDSDAARSERAWLLGTTTLLPAAATVRWVMPVDASFHARFSARSRRYRYSILNRSVRPAIARQFLTWVRTPLDAARMHDGGQCLIGEHDFTSFRTVQCQAHSPVREIRQLALTREDDLIHMDIEANGFLHHMVRNIIGSLIDVGSGERPVSWIADVLAARDRSLAGVTAAPEGLVFVGPRYDRSFGLPAEVSL